ncbi:MAG: hypothetical protein M1832_002272 [Thelocarpon impressellum]|nr:MAG: hypothetical protein M1832_002272 [Thelocarpon impressellum]
MDYPGRPSSFLPAIRCSNCNAEIEISRMGDHVCTSEPESELPPATTDESGPQADHGAVAPSSDSRPWLSQQRRQPPKRREEDGAGFLNGGRMPPSRIDPPAANRPYARNEQRASPGPYGYGRSMSPMTPDDGTPLPFRAPARSATTPLPKYPRPPSLELSNLDCAFPPFPMANSPARSTPTEVSTPYLMSPPPRAEQLPRGPSPLYKPMSPKGSVLQRMNGIAPGPFDIGSRGRSSSPASRPGSAGRPIGHRRLGSSKDYSSPPSATGNRGHFKRPSTAGSESRFGSTDVGGPAQSSLRRAPTLGNATMNSRSGTPIDERDTAKPPSEPSSFQDSFRLEARSHTFPTRGESRSPGVAPTAALPRRPSEKAADVWPRRRSPPSQPTVESGMLAPTATLGTKPFIFGLDNLNSPKEPAPLSPEPDGRYESRLEPASRAPAPRLADEYDVGNPYHTPTESQSSNGSGYGSDTRTGSSRSTPPLPEQLDRSRRAPDPPRFESSPKDYGNPYGATYADAGPYGIQNKPPSVSLSRIDAGQETVKTPRDWFADPYGGGFKATDPDGSRGRTPPREPEPQRRRPSAASKGNCRGCSEPIKGKSVSSADGRLTGRYHRQCFVCRTCMEPFETATFYVLNNHPYCERHYHKLNGSVCQGCDRGIEGQYLETEKKQKFHQRCFTCQDCRKVLEDDYFDMNGKVYCEQHAVRRSQQAAFSGAGRRNPERRTTRMMMI